MKILNDVKRLIHENIIFTAGGMTTAAVAALLGISVGLPIITAFAQTVLNYLIFIIIASGTIKLSSIVIDKIDLITDLDEFLKLNFDKLKASGYNNIDIIEKKCIASRDKILSSCKDKESDKEGFKLLPSKCAVNALVSYMQTCLSELFIYYCRLLSNKGINIQKASSLEYILSFSEELILNGVLNRFLNRFVEILDLINYDVKKFKSEVLIQIKENNFKQNDNSSRNQTFIRTKFNK